MTVYTKTAADVFAPTSGGGAPRGADMGEAQTWGTEVERAIEIATAGLVEAATWSAIDAIDGTRAGQPGQVVGPDAGTHTDPVVGGTVANVGRYAWSTSPAGWQRIGEYVDLDDAKGDYASINARLDDEVTSVPGVFDLLRTKVAVANGASSYSPEGARALGFTIPSGSSGLNSALTVRLDIDQDTAGELAASAVRFLASFAVSSGYARTTTPTVVLTARDGTQTTPAVSSVVSASSPYTVSFTVAIASTTAAIEIIFTQSTSGAAGADQSIFLTDLQMTVKESTVAVQSGAQVMSSVGGRLARNATVGDIGPLLGDSATAMQMFNGATARLNDAGDKLIGWTIPIGETGEDTLHLVVVPISAEELAKLEGSSIFVTLLLDHSDDYDRAFTSLVQDQAGTLATYDVQRLSLSSSQTLVRMRAVVRAGTTELRSFIQSTGVGVAVAEEWLEVADVSFSVAVSQDPMRQPAQLAAHWNAIRAKQQTESVRAQGIDALFDRRVVNTVEEADTGDTISTVIALGGEGGISRRRRIHLAAGTYLQRIIGTPYVDMAGDHQATTIIRNLQADSTSLELITGVSAIEWFWEGDLDRLTIEIENGRYAVHSDNPNLPYGYTQRLRDCTLIHHGNQGARDYQSGLPADPDLVWPYTTAWGTGTGPGWVLDAQRCIFRGDYAAVGVHNNLDFSAPSKMRLRNCVLSHRQAQADGGHALSVQPLGSGVNDVVEVEGCSLDGDILYNAVSWFPTALADQPAAHTEFLIYGHGNSPAVFKITDFGRALKITSAETVGASSVAVSGTGATALFGNVTSKDGAGGFAGYAYGSYDISETLVGPLADTNVHSIGKRLGDCSSVNKTLTVTVDGGTPIDIVFSTDLTAVSNATILATINAALGANATASEFAVGELYRPRFTDEELTLVNTSAVGIFKGMACAYDGDGIRKMTSTDPFDIFAGVAWEDIYPGEEGRVKIKGYLPIEDILRDDTREVIKGVGFSVSSSTAGKWVVGGANPLLIALRYDAVQISDGRVTVPVFETVAELEAAPVPLHADRVMVSGAVLRRVRSDHPRLGAEIVTNGALADGTGWSNNAGWTYTGGRAVGTATGVDSLLYQLPTIDVATYLICGDFTVAANGFGLRVGNIYAADDVTRDGFAERIIESDGADAFGILMRTTTSGTVDNVSVKPLPADAVMSVDGAWWATNEAP